MDNRISLLKLEVFSAVVRWGGVGRAAERMFVSQPVVSAHIRSLEEKVGAALFRKEGRGLELTEAGRRTLAWAENVLEGGRELSEELDALAGGVAGSVCLGATISVGNYLLPDMLVEFLRDFPRVRVSMTQSTTEVVLTGVLDGELDFGMITSGSRIHSARLTTTLVARPELIVVAPVASPFPDHTTLDGVACLPFVCPPTGSGVRSGQDSALAELGVRRTNVVLEAGTAESIKKAVRAGLGVALLSEMSVRDDITAGLLRRIDLDGRVLRDHLYVVRREGRGTSPAQSALIEHLIKTVPSQIP